MPSSASAARVNKRGESSMVENRDSRSDLALRIAGFTAAAHCCLALLLVAGYQVYLVLETFIQPLVWALLTGTFLFPFKVF